MKRSRKLLGVIILIAGSIVVTLIAIEAGEWSGSKIIRIATITVLWVPLAIIYAKWFSGKKG